MTEVQNFDFHGHALRVIDHDGEPWFVAKDVCDVLGYRDPYAGTRTLDDDEKLLHTLCVAGQTRETSIINESGLYSLVLRSNKPDAKAFKKWVTSEVLPSIRKHGAYLTPEKTRELVANPYLLKEMIDRIVADEDEKKRLEEINTKQQKLIALQQPKVDFVDQVFDDGSLVDIGQAAKILNLGFGRNTLFEKLREKGVLFKSRNEPIQKYIHQNLFVLKETEIKRTVGSQIVTKVLVTQKGLYFLKNLFSSTERLGFGSQMKLT